MSFKNEADLEFFKERQRHFRGKAKVRLSTLDFVRNEASCQDINHKNVARLAQVFALEGCLRLEPEHHIPAIVPEDRLSGALQRAGLNSSQLLEPNEPPFLDFQDATITCLHGRHRVEAAKLFLGPFDEWWILDLYTGSMF